MEILKSAIEGIPACDTSSEQSVSYPFNHCVLLRTVERQQFSQSKQQQCFKTDSKPREKDRLEDSSEHRQLSLYIQSEKVQTNGCMTTAIHNPPTVQSDRTMQNI